MITVLNYLINFPESSAFLYVLKLIDREDIKMLVKKWWEIYEDSSLDYKNFVETESKLNPSLITAALASNETGVDALTNLAPSAA